jgi:hypothetical protein
MRHAAKRLSPGNIQVVKIRFFLNCGSAAVPFTTNTCGPFIVAASAPPALIKPDNLMMKKIGGNLIHRTIVDIVIEITDTKQKNVSYLTAIMQQ